MAGRPTLLAHISPRLASGEENLATESLCFVLQQRVAARRGFVSFLSRILARPIPELSFRTQAADADGTIPDRVGIDSSGQPVVYVESKFWAGLTESQPMGYLRRLQRENGIGLVIVAPANRMVTLWPELVGLSKNAGMDGDIHGSADHFRLNVASVPALALTSWHAVLQDLLHAAATSGDSAASEDLRQLRGLCDNMEESGFLPLRLEELTGNVPRRIRDFCGLVDDLTAMITAEGLGSIYKLKATGGSGYYGRWLRLKGNGARIACSAEWWAFVYPTPLWLVHRR